MASNSERPLALYLLGMDAKDQYILGGKDSEAIKAVVHTYVFDSNSVTHCAELAPSYALNLVGIRPVFFEGVKLPDGRREQLLQLFSTKRTKLVQYFHCKDIDDTVTRAKEYLAAATALNRWLEKKQYSKDSPALIAMQEVIEFSKRIPCRPLTFLDHGELCRSQYGSRSRYLEAVIATMVSTIPPYESFTSW